MEQENMAVGGFSARQNYKNQEIANTGLEGKTSNLNPYWSNKG